MNSRLLTLLSIFLIISSVFAQPDSLWSRTYGDTDDDACYTIRQTPGGGYILAGYTMSFGAGMQDYWLVKIDSNGNEEWNHTYGGGDFDYCHSIELATDGGYLLAGSSISFANGPIDFWLVKTNVNGDSLWSRTYGTDGNDQCESIDRTDDGGYVLAGHLHSSESISREFWLVKTSSDGDSLWSRTFGGSNTDEGKSVKQTTDGGFIVAGRTFSFGAGESDMWLVKTDTNGNSLWNRTFGGAGTDGCLSVEETSDGGFVLAGYTDSFGAGSMDFWLVKTDSGGNLLWSRTYGGSDADRCRSVQQTSDGGYILAGITYSFGAGYNEFWMVKANANGDSVWSRTFGGPNIDECHAVIQTADGGYALAGNSGSYGIGIYNNFWLVKTGPYPTIDVDGYFTPLPISIGLTAYPNPFNSELTLDITGFSREVRVSLLNILGQEVEIIHEGVLSGSRIHYAAPAGLSSGLYFVQARNARNTREVRTEKVVFLK